MQTILAGDDCEKVTHHCQVGGGEGYKNSGGIEQKMQSFDPWNVEAKNDLIVK